MDVVLSETAELKKLAIELLRVLVAVDDGCREKVLITQRVYRKRDPKFFQELNVGSFNSSAGERHCGDSKLGSLGYDEDGDCEMRESWVTIDHPMRSSTEP